MSVKYHDLENKRVFVTGGGSGIGASIVEHFCEQDSEVYFVDINVEESNKLVSNIKNKNFKVPTFFECDLLNIKQLQDTISKIISDKGPINILINNAANDERHAIDDVTEEYWNERMNINLRHYFFTVQSVKKSMIKIDENFINEKIKDRNNARKKGDYKLADSIRKELEDNGVIIEDKQNQTTWKYK